MEQVAAAVDCFSVGAEEMVAHSEEVVTSTETEQVTTTTPATSNQAPVQPQTLAQPVANYIPTIISSPGPLMQVVTLQTVPQASTPQAGLTNALRNIRLIAIQPRPVLNGSNGRVQPISLQPVQRAEVKLKPQVIDGSEAKKVAVTNFYSKLKASPVLLAPKQSPQQVVQPKAEPSPANKPVMKKQQQTYVKPSPSFYKEQQREREMKEFPHLSEELSRGLRILLDLTTSLHHSTTWPFMERVDPVKDGAPDYEQVIEKPMWLSLIKEKFKKNEYSSIKEFVADMRLVLENCYRYNGPNHPVTKKALRLEQSFEQKLALLPTDLKEACALQETDEERKARPTSSEAYFSVLLHRVRHDREKREQAAREKKAEEQRLRREEKERQRALWAERMMNPQVKAQMQTMWEIPQLGHFLHLARGALHIGEIAQYELEHMFLMPEASVLLATLMTSLLSSPNQRAKLAESPPTPYSVWSARLGSRVAEWYRTYNREGHQFVKVHELLGIEPMFWRVCGHTNPLDGGRRYHQLSFLKRVWIFKGLCDTVAHSHKTVQEAMAEEEGPESRQVTLGTDSEGYTYLHFPAVSGSDIRVYRQKSWDVEQDPIWGPIVAERKAEEDERIREEERKAEELRLKKEEELRQKRAAAAAAKRTPTKKTPAKKKQGTRAPAQSTPTPRRTRSAPEDRPLRLATRVSPRTIQRQTGLASYKDSSSESEEEDEEEQEQEQDEEVQKSEDEASDNEPENAKADDKTPEGKEAAKKSAPRKRGRGGRRARSRKRPVKKKLQKIDEESAEDVKEECDDKAEIGDAAELQVKEEKCEDDEATPSNTGVENMDVSDVKSDEKPVVEENANVVVKEEKENSEEVAAKEVSVVKDEVQEESSEEKSQESQASAQRFTVSQLIKKFSTEQGEEKMDSDQVPLQKASSEELEDIHAQEDEIELQPDPERSSYDPFIFELIISSVEQLQEWIEKFSDSPVDDEDEEPRKPRPRCEVKLRERLQALLDEAKPLAADQQQANQKICQQLWKEWERYRCSSEKDANKDHESNHTQLIEKSDSEAEGFPDSMSESDDEAGVRKSRRLRVKRSRQQVNGTDSTRSSSPAEEEPASKQSRKGGYGYDPAWESDASAEIPSRRRSNFVPEMKNPEFWVGRRVTRATAAFVETDFSDASNPSAEQPGQPDDSSRSSSQADGTATPDKQTLSPAKTEQLIDQLRQLRRQQALLSSNDPRPGESSTSSSPANGSPRVFLPSKDGNSLVKISNPKAAELLSRIKTTRSSIPSPRTPAGSGPRKILIQIKPPPQANGGSPAQPTSVDISQLIAQAVEKGMIVSEEVRSLSIDLGENGNFLIKAQMTPSGPKIFSAIPIQRKTPAIVSTPPVSSGPARQAAVDNPVENDANQTNETNCDPKPSESELSEPLGTLEAERSPATESKQIFVNDPRQNNIISQEVLQAVAGPEAIGAKLTILKEGNTKVLTLILANGEMRRLTTSQVQQIQAAVRNKTKASADAAASSAS